jgi:hypothetical protein
VNKPRRHHFLSEFYLNGFARDGMLWLYDRERKEFRHQPPKNTAVEKDFYAFENEKGEKDFSVEEHLSAIESKAKVAIEKLENRQEISPDERLYLAHFVALLMVRSPKFDRVVNEIADSAAKHIVKYATPTVAAAGDLVRAHNKKTGSKEISAESMYAFIHDEKFKMVMGRNFVIGTMLETAQKVTLEVAMMDWMVVHADERTAFITTDEPIGFIVPDEFRQSGEPVLGLGSQKITKLVPLSQTVALLLGRCGGGFGHFEFSREQIRDFNLTVAIECDRYVIGRDEALVRSIVIQSKVDKMNPGTRMKVEHIPHPNNPNRTYLVTRRVLADAPDEPLKIIVDDKKQSCPPTPSIASASPRRRKRFIAPNHF